MSLTNGQIPRLANVPNYGVGVLSGSTIGALGSDTLGTTIYSAGTLGGRVYSLMGNTNEAIVANNVWVYILRNSTVVPVGLVSMPVNSGNLSASKFAVDFLDGINIVGLPQDSTGKKYIPLMGSDLLKASTLTGITATKSIWLTAFGADYQI